MIPPLFPNPLTSGGGSELSPAPAAPSASPAAAPPQPRQAPAWLQLLPSLFAIGAGVGGAPHVGTGALQGAEHARLQAEEMRRQQMMEAQRQQQIDMQRAAAEAQLAAREAQQEERRQGAIKAAVDDLRLQQFKSKADYDQAVTFRENLLMQTYGIRPQTLRMLVPYNGPTFETDAADAVNTLVKQHGPEILQSGAMIRIDRDGDGVPEHVPILEAAEIGKVPFLQGPDGKPMVPPKSVKPENLSEFELTLKDTLAAWQAEGKNVADPNVRLAAQDAARERMTKSRKEGQVAATPPPDPAMRELTMETRRQRLEAIRLDNERRRSEVGQLTPGQKSDIATMNSLKSLTDEVLRLGRQHDWAGVGGMGVGSLKDWAARNFGMGSENEVLLRAKLSNLVADIAKLRGGTSFTPNEQQLLERYVPTINEEPLSIIGKLQGLSEFLEQKRQATMATTRVGGQVPAQGAITVTAPNGKTYTFATQEQANRFKAAAGIQ